MHPSPADAPAGVLPWHNQLPARAASLPGGTRRITFPPDRGTIDPAQPDRAGAGHGETRHPRAEMLQMRLTYPLADRHLLPVVPEGVPGCVTASPRSRHPDAILAFALSNRDPLQCR